MCPQTPYSPMPTHLKVFYMTPSPQTLLPLMAPNAPLCPWHTSENILTPLLPSPSWEAALMFCCPVTAVSAWAILKTGPLNPDLLIFQVFKLWLWISPVFPGGSAPQKVGGPRAYPGLLNVLVWPHGPQPARLPCPWNFPGKNTGADCHYLRHRIFPTQGSNPRLLHAGRFPTMWATKT